MSRNFLSLLWEASNIQRNGSPMGASQKSYTIAFLIKRIPRAGRHILRILFNTQEKINCVYKAWNFFQLWAHKRKIFLAISLYSSERSNLRRFSYVHEQRRRKKIGWKREIYLCSNSLMTTWKSKSMRVEIWYKKERTFKNFSFLRKKFVSSLVSFLVILNRTWKRIITRIKNSVELRMESRIVWVCWWTKKSLKLFSRSTSDFPQMSRNVRRSFCNLHLVPTADPWETIRTLQAS